MFALLLYRHMSALLLYTVPTEQTCVLCSCNHALYAHASHERLLAKLSPAYAHDNKPDLKPPLQTPNPKPQTHAYSKSDRTHASSHPS